MKTIGETLKSVREKQDTSLEHIADQTHIKKEFLQAIEAGEFSALPSPVAVQGFISTYAVILGIEPKTALALLRRDYAVSRSHILPKYLVDVPSRRSSQLKARRSYRIVLVVACITTALVYSAWNYLQLHKAPFLTLTAPKDGAVVRTQVIVRGITASDATLEIDGQPASLTQDGEFAQDETLSPGDHTITVIAKNRRNQETIKQVFVHVQE